MNNDIGCGRARAAMPARALPSRGGEDRVRATVGWAATPKKTTQENSDERRKARQGRRERARNWAAEAMRADAFL